MNRSSQDQVHVDLWTQTQVRDESSRLQSRQYPSHAPLAYTPIDFTDHQTIGTLSINRSRNRLIVASVFRELLKCELVLFILFEVIESDFFIMTKVSK